MELPGEAMSGDAAADDTLRWQRVDTPTTIGSRARGEQHTDSPTQPTPHTPKPASIDAPPATTGIDSLHSWRTMVRWEGASVLRLHLFSGIGTP